MNNKKSVYVLLPLVIIVWGVVIYKFLNIKGGSDDDSIGNIAAITKKLPKKINKDYGLLLDYADPFLSSLDVYKSSYYNNVKGKNKSKKSGVNKKRGHQPDVKVSFLGILINESKNKKVGLLEIDAQRYLLSDGDIKNNVEVIKLGTDSVICKIGENKKVIYKKE